MNYAIHTYTHFLYAPVCCDAVSLKLTSLVLKECIRELAAMGDYCSLSAQSAPGYTIREGRWMNVRC